MWHEVCDIKLSDDSDDFSDHGDTGVVTETAKPELKRPSMYRVVLLNDDYTPMDFVIQVLMGFFGMNQEKATQVMLAVHTKGKGVCGVFTRDVAETKANQVNQCARENQHPLLCEVEKV
ncbi:ATP-dependent Clp protease adapter ClpS [Amphritea sp. 1_MG-2023]|uniref:ATP-dependent Clp protease adapter ClpS n=1 Tax=Amphritea sp. 1_MG-2023 TaxID=3062670 RepID=UPI0026E48FA3|nr:ATP-dependent Clp protease adapter ClpS [Amphritea sp. 1_MG-2023]MDO6565233.1 ATP-dependent Clp protease adapter ClpS [Amphritea sp. 1_MG-2023]